MPKEVIKEWPQKKSSKPRIEVRWGSMHNDYVEIEINRGEKFSFLVDPDNVYDGLTVVLTDQGDFDRLIKTLQKAKRQTTFS